MSDDLPEGAGLILIVCMVFASLIVMAAIVLVGGLLK